MAIALQHKLRMWQRTSPPVSENTRQSVKNTVAQAVKSARVMVGHHQMWHVMCVMCCFHGLCALQAVVNNITQVTSFPFATLDDKEDNKLRKACRTVLGTVGASFTGRFKEPVQCRM